MTHVSPGLTPTVAAGRLRHDSLGLASKLAAGRRGADARHTARVASPTSQERALPLARGRRDFCVVPLSAGGAP